jgi:hypothetical protein
MVVLVALAAESVQGWAAYAVRRFEIGRLSSGTLTGAILAIILVAHLDVGGALARGSLPPHEGAWLPVVRARVGPDDLVMADLSTVAGWYLGDLDYWVRSRNYSKYAMQAGDVRRDVHTGAMLVRSLEDFRRQVAPPNGGRTLWVIASGRPYHWDRWVNDDLKRFLDSSAAIDVRPPDGSRILRLDL